MLNNVSLQGRMGGDPIMQKYGDKDKAFFSVAVQRDGKEAATDWIRCVAWGWTASMIGRWFKKGDSIILMGHIETYTDKEGKDRWNVVAERVYFPGSRKDKYDEPMDEVPDLEFSQLPEDDLPF